MFKIILLSLLSYSPSDSLYLVDSNVILEHVSSLNSEENYAESIELLKSVNKADSNYFKVQEELLSTYNAAGLYDSTISLAPSLLKQSCYELSQMWITYGNAYLAKEQYEQAVTTYNEGLKKYPYHHILIYNLGIAHYRQSKYKEAIEYFQRSIRINPFYANSHLMLGYISVLEGHRTKALLCYTTYLILQPTNNGALVSVENLVKDALREEGSVSPVGDNNDFEFYDALIRSKAATDDRFKSKVDFNASINRQLELLLMKLKESPNSDDFWMKYYVPLYRLIQKNGLAEFTINYILQSVNNDNINAYLEKNTKLRSDWADQLNAELKTWRRTNEATVLGEKGNYSFWFYDNNNINGVGNESQPDMYVGPWVFFHDNSQKSAEGRYSQDGKKIGEWTYWFDNGEVKRLEYYDDNGSVTKPAIYYRYDGSIATEVPFVNDKAEGIVKYYYGCDQVKEAAPYVANVLSGNGQYFYESGIKKVDYHITDGKLDSLYTIYFQTGNISEQYTYVAGELEGVYKSWYHNGQLQEEGLYKEGKASGDWKGYHEDGALKFEGSYLEDKKFGQWNHYKRNGNLGAIENFNNDGKLDGTCKYYHRNGFILSEEEFSDGKQVAYKIFDEKGKVLSEAADANGNMAYEGYLWTGRLRAKGTFKDGKLNGSYELYYPSGLIWRKGTMKDGKWDGEFYEYYLSGVLQIHCNYNEGKYDGLYQTFHENGAKQTEGYFVDGEKQQRWRYYLPDGQLSGEDYFVDGSLEGDQKIFSSDGRLWAIKQYKTDKLIAYDMYDTAGMVLQHTDLPFASGEMVDIYPNGKPRFKSVSQCGYYVDEYKYYYPDGSLHSEHSLAGSAFHGAYKKFNYKGSIEIEGDYKNGSANGHWTYYFLNGKKELISTYLDDELNGLRTRYYENGQEESIYSYIDGDRQGPSTYYDREGHLQIIKHYDKDAGVVAYQYNLTNGELSDSIKFTGVEKEIIAYFPNGKKSIEQHFKNGAFHGTIYYYNTEGKVIEEGNFDRGNYHGDYIKYYSDGQICSKVTYVDDQKSGTEYQYYPNGNLRYTVEYINDERNGWERFYDTNGKKVKEFYYWNDNIYE